jgi:acyl carrier protein
VFQLKKQAAAESVLAPKVQGAIILDSLLARERLDFFIHFSSLNSITGGVGQVDYCAANAFLDAFAQRSESGKNGLEVSINWDSWNEVGMLARWQKRLAGAGLPESIDPEAILHPLFDRRISRKADGEEFVTRFSPATHWVLNEHRIVGNPVIPGTAYLEMARAAFESVSRDHADMKAVELRDIFFLTPLRVGDGEESIVQTAVERTESGHHFIIKSRPGPYGGESGSWQDHAIGTMALVDREAPKKRDIAELYERCNLKEINGEDDDQKETGIGPRWDNLKKVRVGKNELLATFELSEEFESDLIAFKLHPALLDAATGVAKKHLADDGVYLPLSYKRLTVRGDLTRKVYSYARFKDQGYSKRETMAYDIVIMDEDGVELLEIEEYTAKRVNDVDSQLKALADMQAGARSPDAGASGSPVQGELSPREGVEIFKRVLSGHVPQQVIVSVREIDSVIEEARSFAQGPGRSGAAIPGARDAAPGHARPEMQSDYVPPSNETERALADLWQEMLGIDRVGINDNFFELGGDSVLAIQVISRANQAGIQITPQQLFQFQTIAELASVSASGAGGEAASAPAPPLQHRAPDQERAKSASPLASDFPLAKLDERKLAKLASLIDIADQSI